MSSSSSLVSPALHPTEGDSSHLDVAPFPPSEPLQVCPGKEITFAGFLLCKKMDLFLLSYAIALGF